MIKNTQAIKIWIFFTFWKINSNISFFIIWQLEYKYFRQFVLFLCLELIVPLINILVLQQLLLRHFSHSFSFYYLSLVCFCVFVRLLWKSLSWYIFSLEWLYIYFISSVWMMIVRVNVLSVFNLFVFLF